MGREATAQTMMKAGSRSCCDRWKSMLPPPAGASEMGAVDHETLTGWLTRLQL